MPMAILLFELTVCSTVLQSVRLTALVSIVPLASDDHGTCMYSLIAYQSNVLVSPLSYSPHDPSDHKFPDNSLTELSKIG